MLAEFLMDRRHVTEVVWGGVGAAEGRCAALGVLATVVTAGPLVVIIVITLFI